MRNGLPDHPGILYNPAMALSNTARSWVLGILLLGLAGTLAELLLLGHFEDWKQWIPLTALGAALLLLALYAVTRGAWALRGLRMVAVAAVVAGAAGLFFHYRGNVEFEREMYPALNGLGLVWEALRGATPALAPGTMIQLGLLIWLYLYRHPVLQRDQGDPPT